MTIEEKIEKILEEVLMKHHDDISSQDNDAIAEATRDILALMKPMSREGLIIMISTASLTQSGKWESYDIQWQGIEQLADEFLKLAAMKEKNKVSSEQIEGCLNSVFSEYALNGQGNRSLIESLTEELLELINGKVESEKTNCKCEDKNTDYHLLNCMEKEEA